MTVWHLLASLHLSLYLTTVTFNTTCYCFSSAFWILCNFILWSALKQNQPNMGGDSRENSHLLICWSGLAGKSSPPKGPVLIPGLRSSKSGQNEGGEKPLGAVGNLVRRLSHILGSLGGSSQGTEGMFLSNKRMSVWIFWEPFGRQWDRS